MSNWIDFEVQRPENGQRVIILMPFGQRVADDTWTDDHGWLNNESYISHWQPINPPGTYAEIMDRPAVGTFIHKQDDNRELAQNEEDKIFSDAITSFISFFTTIYKTEFIYRFEKNANKLKDKNHENARKE